MSYPLDRATCEKQPLSVHPAMSPSLDWDEEMETSDEHHQQHHAMSLSLVSELAAMESDVERESLRSWQPPEHRTHGRTT